MTENNKYIPELRNLTEEEQKSMKVNHYTLRLPNTLTKPQLEFIINTARSVANNEPFVIIKHEALRFVLQKTIQYRNILFEFDEDKRWTIQDENFFETLQSEFKDFIDWLQKEYKIKVEEWDK